MGDRRPLITCARCGELRKHSGRMLCGGCVYRSNMDGTLVDYPRMTLSAKWVIEEMQSPAMRGMSYVDIAMAMGLTLDSARASYRRARKKGWL